MISYKQRTVNYNKPVLIYRNLTKGKSWLSVKQGNLVVAHAQEITLKDCAGICNQKIRDYSIKVKRKFVHTFIKGFICDYVKCNEDLNFSMISSTEFTISNNIFTKSRYINFNNGVLKTKI